MLRDVRAEDGIDVIRTTHSPLQISDYSSSKADRLISGIADNGQKP